MEVKIVPQIEKSVVELDVTVPAKKFEPFIKRAAKELTTEHPLPGFRPGLAPVPVVIENLGEERLLKKALDVGLPHLFIRALVKNNIDAIGQPSFSVQELGLSRDLRFIATVAIVPKVRLGDPKKIIVHRRKLETTDAEIEQELKHLARLRSTTITVARAAQQGDTVVVDFKVTMNGQIVDGGESKNHPVHLGEGHFIPDFEQQLIGTAAGEERQFVINFPADFPREEYQGKEAAVWVKIHEIRHRVTPELNDDFAHRVGKFDDLNHLKRELKHNITHEKEHKERDRMRGELTRKLAAISEFDPLPEVLLNREIEHELAELKQMLALQRKTFEQYLTKQKKTAEQIRAELQPEAEEQIKIALAVRVFAQEQKITIDAKDVDAKAQEYMSRFATVEQAKQSVDTEELRDNIAANLKNQAALDRLEELATIEDKTK